MAMPLPSLESYRIRGRVRRPVDLIPTAPPLTAPPSASSKSTDLSRFTFSGRDKDHIFSLLHPFSFSNHPRANNLQAVSVPPAHGGPHDKDVHAGTDLVGGKWLQTRQSG